jgi:hypothetical protein
VERGRALVEGIDPWFNAPTAPSLLTGAADVSGRTVAIAEATLALASLVLFALAIVLPRWIESLLGADLDGGSGALEWVLPLVFAALTGTFATRARAHWRAAAQGVESVALGR